MSRPAEAVHAVIKAYDVRGLVGEQIDEAFVRDVGGAFARLVRDEGPRELPCNGPVAFARARER